MRRMERFLGYMIRRIMDNNHGEGVYVYDCKGIYIYMIATAADTHSVLQKILTLMVPSKDSITKSKMIIDESNQFIVFRVFLP